MKKILSDLLKLSLIIIPPKIANAFYSRIFSPSIISFMFHAVSNETVPHIKYLFPILDEKRFENSILYLKNKYEFIDYEKLIRINKKGKVTKTRVFLSFDDGYSECFDVVRPILVKHKIPCTFFITTDWIDNKNIFYGNKISICLSTLKEKRKDQISVLLLKINRKFKLNLHNFSDFENWVHKFDFNDENILNELYEILELNVNEVLSKKIYMSKGEIKQMVLDGFTIGAHSKSHKNFQLLPTELIEEEVTGSINLIQEITGAEEIPFAFPYSANNIELDKINHLRKKIPKLGLLFGSNGLIYNKGIVNRIWGENPELIKLGKETHIPYIIHKAYLLKIIDKLLSLFKINK